MTIVKHKMDCEWTNLNVTLSHEIIKTLEELKFSNTTPVQVPFKFLLSSCSSILLIGYQEVDKDLFTSLGYCLLTKNERIRFEIMFTRYLDIA